MGARREDDRPPYICVLFLMLCDWLILTWHLPTLERAIKSLSEELIERFTQIAHIWGFNEGWNNENNIVCTGVFFSQRLNLPSGSRAPLLPNIRVSLPILSFDVWLSFFLKSKYGSFWRNSDLAILFFLLEVLTFMSDEFHRLNIAILLKQSRRNWIVSVLYKFV